MDVAVSRPEIAALFERYEPALVVAGVTVAFDRGVLDRAVHPLDLTVRPWAAGLVKRCSILVCSRAQSNACRR